MGYGALMLEESSPASVLATAMHSRTGAASREGVTYPPGAGLDPEEDAAATKLPRHSRIDRGTTIGTGSESVATERMTSIVN